MFQHQAKHLLKNGEEVTDPLSGVINVSVNMYNVK